MRANQAALHGNVGKLTCRKRLLRIAENLFCRLKEGHRSSVSAKRDRDGLADRTLHLVRRYRFQPSISLSFNITEFKLFIEELEHAAELILSGRRAKERMALVILDSLADRLLYQHAHRHLEAAEYMVWRRDPQFTAKEQNDLLQDFAKKTRLGAKDAEWPYPNPILEASDVSVFRVAHAYRNAGYHRGEHNDALTSPLGRLYAIAIAGAFPRSLTDVLTGGLDDRLLDELDRFDWRGPGLKPGQFRVKEAAERICAEIAAPLAVDTRDLAKQLVVDFEARCGVVQEILESPRIDGVKDAFIETMLDAALDWARHRGDAELLALKDEQHALIERASNASEVTAEHRDAIRQNELAQFKRIADLSDMTEHKFNLGSAARLRERAERIRTLRSLSPLIERYRSLDEELGLLEAAADRMATEWDRFLQLQTDIARGK